MITIIFPLFNEIENIKILISEVKKEIHRINQKFELLFIDDASTDGSYELLHSISGKNPSIKVIRFARNFGSHAAITCGLSYAKGNAAIVLASDLQDPPEVIGKLIKAWKTGVHIVWGVRKSREGVNRRTKFFSRIYYLLINWLTIVKIPPQGTDIFLIDKTVIDAFNQVREKHSSVFMILAWLGFSQQCVYYKKRKRYKGISKWTVLGKIKLVLDSILSFSDIPIRYGSVVGIITASFGFMYAVYSISRSVLDIQKLEGWSLVLIIVLIVSGIQMTILGILGEYLWRTFDESRRRPRYIIQNTINLP